MTSIFVDRERKSHFSSPFSEVDAQSRLLVSLWKFHHYFKSIILTLKLCRGHPRVSARDSLKDELTFVNAFPFRQTE